MIDAPHDWAGSCMGRNSITRLHFPITTVQSLAPNGITSTRWQQLNLGYFGIIFLQWKKVDGSQLSLFMSVEGTNPQKKHQGSSQICGASFSFTVMVQSHCSHQPHFHQQTSSYYKKGCDRAQAFLYPRAHAKTSVYDEPCI